MRIYRMTATFGKLEHETLQLQPGLNIIHAPNEWGKSTWCAFLVAMLYGLDTRAKTTKTTLADKERYAPWSGAPMAGRMDLCWNGRDITIERRTKGRIPMGDFRAYETASGLAVPELTAANCGQSLLGVEQSVFRRAGFIRLSDLPVTADDSLRRRLNALVTTGDESGDGERLARELRDLRNRCRYNRSGLIPQAERELEELENKLSEWETLQSHSGKLKRRLGEEKSWLRQLRNHQDALAFAAAEADTRRVAEARDARDRAVAQWEALECACASLPSREEAEKKLRALQEFQACWNDAQREQQLQAAPPEPPAAPGVLEGMPLEQASEMVREDARRYERLKKTKPWRIWILLSAAFLLLAVGAGAFREFTAAAISGVLGLIFLPLGLGKRSRWRAEATALEAKYGSEDPAVWTKQLKAYETARRDYEQALRVHRAARGDLDVRLARLQTQRASLCGEQPPETVMGIWQQVLNRWEEYHTARREAQRAQQHLETLQAMAKTAALPQMQDDLTYTAAETARLIADAEQEQQRLHSRLGQYQGRMEALGEEKTLRSQQASIRNRLQKLEDTYSALTIALETLNEARLELQRRFAPRIAKRAQALLGEMTDGRYDRLILGEDFSLRVGAGEEETLHDALWRSDGTVDQLYLALRLVVSEALTPHAPIVLDDALARFDDTRMQAALSILQKESETKQVILFSCQSREKEWAGK